MTAVAYLVSDHDAPSHTFVRREIAALRALGIAVKAFSIHPAEGGNREAEALLGRSPIAYIAALAWALFGRPLRFLSSWRLSCQHRAPGLKALIWSQFHFVEAVLLAQRMHDLGIRYLHNHFANSGASVGMIASHLIDIRWSLTLHGISETDHPAGMLLAGKIERASFVACASYFMRAQAMRVVDPMHWRKLGIVRCGVDLATLPPPGPARSGAKVRLVCVGRLSPEKGHFGLLEALNRMAADAADFSLVIVGDGPSGKDIRARVVKLGLSDHVLFTGALPERETLEEIARSDILILPSLMEGLPVVLVEAMALGKPVVASRVAGIPELVAENESGYLFAPSDWSDLERSLRRLLTKTSDWGRMGASGRRRVEEAFQIRDSALEMSRLLGVEIAS